MMVVVIHKFRNENWGCEPHTFDEHYIILPPTLILNYLSSYTGLIIANIFSMKLNYWYTYTLTNLRKSFETCKLF